MGRDSQKQLNQPQGAQGHIDQLDAHKRSNHTPGAEHKQVAPQQLLGIKRPKLHTL